MSPVDGLKNRKHQVKTIYFISEYTGFKSWNRKLFVKALMKFNFIKTSSIPCIIDFV